MIISPHFTLEELTFSQLALRTGLDNTPEDEDIANLKLLCASLLEPVRTLLGVPLHVDSGYRSPQVNAAVGGAHASAHMYGRAADVIPIGMDLRTAFDQIRSHKELPIDQIIIECNAWIHLAIAATGTSPRGEALLASGSAGHWTYQPA